MGGWAAICGIAGEWGKPSCYPRGLIPIPQNQSRKVETVILKGMITKVDVRNLQNALYWYMAGGVFADTACNMASVLLVWLID